MPDKYACQSDEDCGPGKVCVQGVCQTAPRRQGLMCKGGICTEVSPDDCQRYPNLCRPCSGKAAGDPCEYKEPGKKTLACINGVCTMVGTSTPEQIGACSGKKEGDACTVPPYTPVPPGPGTCPEGITPGAAHEGCAPCGKKYMLPKGQTTCLAGYVPVQKPEGTQCECLKWCRDIGCDDTCHNCGKGKAGDLGEFAFPENLQNLFDSLMGRSKEFLNLAPGYTPEAMNKMFGQDFSTIRSQEAQTKEQVARELSKQGLLGTGTALETSKEISRGTEGNVANLMRDLFIKGEEKKKQDLLDYTGAAQSLFGSGLGYSQLLEAINASRRGEGNTALQLLLAMLQSMGG